MSDYVSTNVQILKVTDVYSLLAKTQSLHVHYGCALFTMTSRISSRAEHCCTLNHQGGNCCDSGVHHIVVATPFQQPHHRPVNMPKIVRIIIHGSLNIMYIDSDIKSFCQSCSRPVIKLAQPCSCAVPPVHHRQDVAAAELADSKAFAPAAHKHSMFTVQGCKLSRIRSQRQVDNWGCNVGMHGTSTSKPENKQ